MEDVIVTLLDGTEVTKSEVPVGTIYINENGVKVKKVAVPAVRQEPKSLSFFGSITAGINQAKSKIAAAVQIADLAVVKIREILQTVDFNMIRDLVGQYKQLKRGDADKLKQIDSLLAYIDVLEKFANGGDLEAPSDAVLDIAKEIAEKNQCQPLLITLNVLQIIIKANRGVSDIKAASSVNEAMTTLNAMVAISVSDGVVTDEEFARLKAQAAVAGVTDDKLQEMINAAMPK